MTHENKFSDTTEPLPLKSTGVICSNSINWQCLWEQLSSICYNYKLFNAHYETGPLLSNLHRLLI